MITANIHRLLMIPQQPSYRQGVFKFYFVFIVLCLLHLILSGEAFVGFSTRSCQFKLSDPMATPPLAASVLSAKKMEAPGNEDESSGFFSRFRSSKNKEKKKDEPKEEEESSGIFKSISKRLESRKETRDAKNRAKKEAELRAILEKESRIGGISSYFPNFNTTRVTSAFRNVPAGFSQARDDIRSIRPGKAALSLEEKRLAELRQRSEAEKQRRLQAQQSADKRTVERRKKKEQEELEKREAKAKASEEDGNNRFSPLSVAQNYVSSFFDSQKKEKEEWFVVAPKTRISPGEMVPVTAAGLDLLLVASKDGSSLYCTANSCPHLGTPLEVGMLERRPIESSSNQENGAKMESPSSFQETDITSLLSQDGCEDCIVCPLHRTAFALESGEVRGEWCPYPPVIGKVMGTVKSRSSLPIFDVRIKGKNIEVRLNTPLQDTQDDGKK